MAQERTARTSPHAWHLLDNLNEGVIVVTRDGAIQYSNPAARKLLGLSREPFSLDDIYLDIAPGEPWQALLDAPGATYMHTGVGPIQIQSHVTDGDPDLIQLLLNPGQPATPQVDSTLSPATAGIAPPGADVLAQLTSLSRISHGLNATLELEGILTLILHEAIDHIDANGGRFSLWNRETGRFEGLVSQGNTTAVDPALEEKVSKTGQMLVVGAATDESDANHPILISPVLYEGIVAGLLCLFGDAAIPFDEQRRTFIQTLVNHAAIAIGNDRRFTEMLQRTSLLQRRAQQIERFVESGRAFQSDRPLSEVYDELVHAIQEGVGFKVVLLSLIEENDPQLRLHRIAAAGLPLDRLREMQHTHHYWENIAQLLQPEYALGGTYFVPQEIAAQTQALEFYSVQDLYPSQPETEDESTHWNNDDIFFVPLRDSTGQPLGLISLDAPENGRRPDMSVAKALEIFAIQTTSAVENIRLFHNMRQYAERLQQLHDISRQVLRELDFDRQLQLIVNGLQSVGWERVVLTLREPDLTASRLIAAGLGDSERETIWSDMIAPEVWRTWLNDEQLNRFRRASCYFLPADDPWVREHFARARRTEDATPGQSYAWHQNDLLFVPLYDRQQRVMALIGLDSPVNARRPDARMLQTIELYAQFATAVIENSQLVTETIARSQELRTLFEASRAISSTLEPDKVLAAMGDHMLQAIHADGYAVYQQRADSDGLGLILQRSPEMKAATSATAVVSLDGGTAVHTALTQEEPLVVDQAADLPAEPAWLAAENSTVALLPLNIREEIFGLVAVASYGERRSYKPEEIQLLGAFVNQASIALENARLFKDTSERERFYAALGRVSLAINVTLDLPSVLNLICQESLGIFHVEGAYIWERHEDTLIGKAAQGTSKEAFLQTTLPLDETNHFAASVAHRGQARYINNFRSDGKIRLALPQKQPVRALLGIPLKQENEVIGVMVLVDHKAADRFGHRDIEYATTFGVQAAIAIQNARLVTELRELNERLDERVASRTQALEEESERVRILLRITTELSSSLDQDRVLNQALRLVNEVVSAEQGVILLVDQNSDEMISRASFGMDDNGAGQNLPRGLKRREGLAGWMIKNRTPIVVNDTQEDSRWAEWASDFQHRSILAVPLGASDEVVGALMMFHTMPNAFTGEQLDLVEAAAIQVANALSNANLYLLIRDQAERLGNMLREEQIEAAKSEAILQSIADGVLVADVSGHIILANMPASKILGIPREQLLGKSVKELRGLYGASGDTWIQTIQQWAEDAASRQERSYLADQIAIEERVVSVHVSPVFAHIFAHNQYFGTVSIFRDVTKEVEVDRMKSEFVSTVSHELRTPMTSIKGYADLMLMGAAGALAGPQTRYLQVIKNNADRLHMLVNDLLDISRIETGKTELDLRPLDIAQLVDQVVDGHLRGRIQHQKKELHVVTDLAPSLPLVRGDVQRVTQVLTNLLDNAFNYTPVGGEIKVRAVANGRTVAISVTDSGIGISKENQEKIFDRFFRADDQVVQKVAGTGLGLAIVRSLVEMHGGTLNITSEPGQGSTFTFTLSVVTEEAGD